MFLRASRNYKKIAEKAGAKKDFLPDKLGKGTVRSTTIHK